VTEGGRRRGVTMRIMSVPANPAGPPAGLRLRLTGDCLAVCRLDAGAGMPPWAGDAPGFLSVSRTADEVSIVCAAASVPSNVRHEAPFRLLQVAGPVPFETVGIMAVLSGALAGAGVSILPIGTFDTDYLLVREADVDRSLDALRGAGCAVEVGDTLA
jgi:hypothetical protein